MWVLALGTLALMRDPGGVALVNGLPAVVGPLPVGVLAWAAVMAVAATAGLTLLLPTLVIMTAGSLLTHSVPFLPALRVALRYRRALLALAGLGAAAGAGVTVVLTSVESFWPKVAIAGVAAVVLLPLPLAVPAVVLEGRTASQAVSRAFELTRARSPLLVLAPAICPAVAALDWWPPGRPAVLSLLVAVQAMVMTLVFLLALTRGWRGDALTAFRAMVDALPSGPFPSARPGVVPVAALAGLALPGLLLTGVTAANPMNWPAYQQGELSGRSSPRSFSHFSVSADGRAALIRDDVWLSECTDALCTKGGTAPVPAGTHQATAVAGRPLELCWNRTDDCEPGSGLPLPEFTQAVAAAPRPGGPGPVVAVLAPDRRARSSLWLLHCGDPRCGSATRTRIADVDEPYLLADEQQLAVTVTADGRPVVVRHSWALGEVAVFTCDSPACAGTRRTVPVASEPPAADPTRWGNQPHEAAIDPDGQEIFLDQSRWGNTRPAVAIGPDGRPLVLYHDAVSATPVLLECTDLTCATARRVPVPAARSYDVRGTLAVDGRGRILVATFTPGGTVSLATCAGTCTARPVGTYDGIPRGVQLAIDSGGNPLLAWMSVRKGDGWRLKIIRPVSG